MSVRRGGDSAMHIWKLATPTHLWSRSDWQLPARVPVTLDGNVAEVQNVAAN
jgi:hypothetical protein